MKKYLFIIIAIVGVAASVGINAPKAHAARLNTIGFELQTTTANAEITSANVFGGSDTSGTVTSSLAHSGNWSYDFTTTAGSGLGYYQFSATGASTTYARAYLYIRTLPDSTSTFFGITNVANDNFYAALYLTPGGQIGVEYAAAGGVPTYGTTTVSISTGVWNYVEVSLSTASANTQAVTGRLNGVTISSQTGGATLAANQNSYVGFGGSIVDNLASTQEYLFDDIAINDAGGSSQNSWPGPGNDVFFVPSGSGDVNNWKKTGNTASSTTNWNLVNNIKDFNGTAYVEQRTPVNLADLYNTDSSSTIPGTATINLVQLGVRYADSATSPPSFKIEAEKTSGSTLSTSAAITPGATTYVTNANSAPFNPPLTLYNDPTGSAWTPTTVGTMQFGEIISTVKTTPFDRVSNIWAYVEYVPVAGSAPDATSVSTTVNSDGARSGDSITITGTNFGTVSAGSRATCNGGAGTGCVQFVTGGTATVADTNVTAWSNTSITFTVSSTLASNGGASALEVWAANASDTTPLTFYIYPKISSVVSVGTNAAREYNAADTDGLIMLVGDHFGTTNGTSTILGSTATLHGSTGGSCSVASFTSSTACFEVPTGIANNTYSGTIILNRASDSKQATTSLSILPRILSMSPTSAANGALVQILGDHLCQSGTCPVSPNRSNTTDHVSFGTATSSDSDFVAQSGGGGACNGGGAAWTDSEICVNVPAAGSVGGVTTVITSNGNATNGFSFTITGAPTPGAPGVPTYASVNSSTLIANWTVASGTVSYYKIERATSSQIYTQISTTTSLTYSDSSLGANATYYYRVRGTNAGGDGSYSASSSVLTLPDKPGMPTFASVNSSTLTVNWTAPTGGATYYKIERAPDSGGSPGSFVQQSTTTLLTYNDTGLSASTTYWYRVRATNATGDGAYSSNASTTTGSGATVVTLDATSTGGSAALGTSLTWSHTIGASGTNRLLTVGVAIGTSVPYDGHDITGLTISVTYNGVSLTSAGSQSSFNNVDGLAQLFYLTAPATGTHNIIVTVTGGTADIEAGGVSFVNVNQSAPLKNIVTNNGESASATLNVTSTVGDMVVDVIANGSAVDSSNKTLRWVTNLNTHTAGGNGAQSTAAGASTVAMGYTLDIDDWGIVGADVAVVGGTNSAPNAPSQDAPTSALGDMSITPTFNMTATDPDGNALQYKVTIYSNSGCTTAVQTDDESASQTGWSGQNTSSSKEYTSGTQGAFTVQTALGNNTTYYWKASAKDPEGSNTWTDSASCNSFTTSFGNWTTDSGTWTISSNALTVTPASGTSVQLHLSNFSPSNDVIEFKAKSSKVGANSGNVAGIARADTGANRYHLVMGDFLNQRTAVGKTISSAYSALASSSFTFSASTYAEFRGSISGTTLKSWINGANALTVTDGALSSGGIGLEASSTNGSAVFTFDDFAVYTGTTVSMSNLPGGGCWAVENNAGTIIASTTGGSIDLATYTGQVPVDYDNGGGTVAVWANSTCTGASAVSASFGPSYTSTGDGIFGGDSYSYNAATAGIPGTAGGSVSASSSIIINSVGQVSY